MSTPITLLTLSHQYGSGGSLIARDLGQRLNWKVWDKEIVQTIASRQHVSKDYIETKDERVGSFIERVVESFGVGGFEIAYNIPPPLRLKDSQLARLTRTLIEEVSQEGSTIIVGRGGNCILANRPKTLHVFVFASLDARIERVMKVEGLTVDEAKRRITGMDKLRTDYVHKFYQAEWRDSDGYNLQLDSSVWGETGTADFIIRALEHHTDKE